MPLAQAVALQLDPMGAVNHAIQNGIAQGGGAESVGMPLRLTGESLKSG